ncbi:Phospholipid-translocating P-type ATPase [Mycena kentingensis (nom. inval.)]|nr:Phospholipid-translocating P-type ATPase [Mycena kentingensis (nom. inval.)]
MRKPQSRIARWYEAVAGFKPLPPDYLDPKGRVKPEHKHLSNQVITSKYTLLTFLPRDLLEQFRRVANVFFLAIAVLQFFPKFSTISPGLVIFPLLVVLTFTACKDAYEDTKRHQSDRKVNHSIVRVLDIPNNNAMKGKHRTFLMGSHITHTGIILSVAALSSPPCVMSDRQNPPMRAANRGKVTSSTYRAHAASTPMSGVPPPVQQPFDPTAATPFMSGLGAPEIQ